MAEHGEAAVARIKELGLHFQPESTVWLGHDRITGNAAISAARTAGGRSAVIHHMSYAHYETYAETSQSADAKTEEQSKIFQEADIVLAVGPLLRDAAKDLVQPKPVHMLVPGLAEIDAQDAPTTFVAFLSARLTDDAARIKQGHLGIAAFATAHKEAVEEGRPDSLTKQPKLVLRGLDPEGLASPTGSEENTEDRLKKFAAEYADAVVNLHTLPFTEAKEKLYEELSRASVCLMPSWHEGFGLGAWEAIAAGVPLIISRNSGVYQLLDEKYTGAGPGCVYPIVIGGKLDDPFFTEKDLEVTTAALKSVAYDPRKARRQASVLRNMLGVHTWAACASEAAEAFAWQIAKGAVSLQPPAEVQPQEVASTPTKVEAGPLLIPTGKWQPNAGMADSQLLRAEEALLDFDPRRLPEINELRTWMDDERWLFSVRLVTGAGGQGKTRLALEICNQSIAKGWHAGFLDSNLEVAAIGTAWRQMTEIQKPLLIVIDYAETRQPALLAIVKAALANPSKHPARLLLLARDGGEWWDNLPAKDSECEAILSGYATTGPFRLTPLYEAKEDRHDAYRRSLSAFSNVLQVTAPTIDPDLTGEHFERPLYIQMAALLALYGEQPVTAQGLTRGLLNHERRYWSRLLAHFNWQDPERRAEQLLALSTLAGGFSTANSASSYWNTAKAGVLNTAEFNALFRELATLYPGTQGLEALRPDLLGEALVAQALLRPSGDSLLDSVLASSATHDVRRNALTVAARLSTQRSDLQEILIGALSRHLTHCSADVVAVSRETRSRLPELTELAFQDLTLPRKSQVSGLLLPLLGEESVELAGLSCKIHEYLCGKSLERLNKKPADVNRIGQHAKALDAYSISLGRLGRYEQACHESLRSSQLYRKLLGRGLKQFESDYAASLTNYAVNLSRSGKADQALEQDEELLAIRKRQAHNNPKPFEPRYALALNNYAVHLNQLDRNDEALMQDDAALVILERLWEKNPNRFEPDYATLLSNHASHLSAAGKYEQALKQHYASLDMHKRLWEKNPDRFEPDYARSLSDYANRLSETGRPEEALQHDAKALEIRKRLAQKDPDRFEEDYASSLINCALHLNDTGTYEDALQAATDALGILTRLAQKQPTRFTEHFFFSVCLVRCLSWLCLKHKNGERDLLDDRNQALTLLPDYKRSLIRLYSDFVRGCEATNPAARKERFRGVRSQWRTLSTAAKSAAEPSWLCAAAWCTKFDKTDYDEWRDVWREYKNRRNGRIPHWMIDVADRLEFEWPE